MHLPTQAPGVNRANRLGAAQAAGVNPAFWGGVFDVLKKAGSGALNAVLS